MDVSQSKKTRSCYKDQVKKLISYKSFVKNLESCAGYEVIQKVLKVMQVMKVLKAIKVMQIIKAVKVMKVVQVVKVREVIKIKK